MYVPTQTNKPTWTTRGSVCFFVSFVTVVLCVFRCRKKRVGGKCTQPCLWDLLQLQIVNSRVGDDRLVSRHVYKNSNLSHIPQWKLLVLGVFRWTLLTYILTYSMVQSPSWEANWFAASQEIPRISRNPKVHYRTHKRPPPVSILGQRNPVHIPTSQHLEIHPNVIYPSTPRSPQWSPSLRFPHQYPIHHPLLTMNLSVEI